MKKIIHEKSGKPYYEDAELSTILDINDFYKIDYEDITDNIQIALHTNLGSITVLDRLTGYIGYIRDVESGYRDNDGNFWLASGNKDVLRSGCKTLGEAIEWIKENANTCKGT